MVNRVAISGASQPSRKLFYYGQLVKYTPSMTTPIERALKTEQTIMVFAKKACLRHIKKGRLSR